MIALYCVFASGYANACDAEIAVAKNVSAERSITSLLEDVKAFEIVENNAVVEGKSSTNIWWMRIENADPNCDITQWLRLKYPYLSDVTVFDVHPTEQLSSSAEPFVIKEQRPLGFLYPIVPLLSLTEESENSYLIRINYPDRLILPIRVSDGHEVMGEGFWFLAISLILIVFLLGQACQAISLGKLRSRPDRRAFIIFTTSAATYVSVSSGLLSVLSGGSIFTDPRSLLLIAQAIVVWGAVEFLRCHSEKKPLQKIDGLLRMLQIAAIATVIIDRIAPQLADIAFLFAFVIAPLILLALLVWSALRGIKGAITLVIAWTPTILAVVWIYSRVLGITPYHPINHHLAGIGLFLTSLQFNALLSLNRRKDAHAADHDALTGLPNRRAMEKLTARAAEGEFSIQGVALIDLRKFKQINDTYGHAAGDWFLAQIAHRLRCVLPKGSQIFRIGGDEFVFISTQRSTFAEFESTVNTLRYEVELPIDHAGEFLTVGASIGAIFGPLPLGTSFSTILKRADTLAYEAKSSESGACVLMTWTEFSNRSHEQINSLKDSELSAVA
ncbi:MAG: diguanylate cyclase domain-containing protein [Henriciella sp.]